MLSAKPWRAEAIIRFMCSLLACLSAGQPILAILQPVHGLKPAIRLYGCFAGSLLCLGTTVFLLRKPWRLENVLRRLLIVLATFYCGAILAFATQSLAGASGPSVLKMIVAALSFQGAILILAWPFVR